MLSALSLFGADHPAGPGKPAIGGCQMALQQQRERHPKQATGRSLRIVRRQIGAMATLQRLPALIHVAQKVGRRGQRFKILARQRTRSLG